MRSLLTACGAAVGLTLVIGGPVGMVIGIVVALVVLHTMEVYGDDEDV